MVTENKSNDPIRYKRGSSALKKVWDYMRRNRTFRFGDVMAITGVTHSYLTSILWHLKAIDYVVLVEKKKPYSLTQFTLVKCTGVKSPSIINGAVYDYNINKEFIIEKKSALEKILSCMTKSKMSKHEIAVSAGVSEDHAKKLFKKLTDLNVISDIEPPEKIDGRKAFEIDLDKVKLLKDDKSHEIHQKVKKT